jgi:hypothetical protein
MTRKIAAALSLVVMLGASTAPASAALAAARQGDAGKALFSAGDFDRAESAFSRTLAKTPHDPEAELGLARIALYRNDLDQAQVDARAFARDAPSDPRASALLAAIDERRDRNDYRVAPVGTEVHVRLERIDPLPEVVARVNGRRAKLLIDTGGPGLDLSPALVNALGVPTKAAGNALFAGSGRGAVRTGHIASLELASATIRSIPIHVPPELPPGVDGVIGTQILYRFLATIDYVRHDLILRPKTASSAFLARARARGAVSIPMLLVPDHFIFARARVNAGPVALFSIDTGGPGIGLDVTKSELAAAAIVPDAAHSVRFRGGGGAVTMLPFTAAVTIGRTTFGGIPGVYAPDGDGTSIFPFRVAGRLSHELFKRGALTFDFSAMTLVFDAPQLSESQ